MQYSYFGDELNDVECNARPGVSLFVDTLTEEHAEIYKFEVPPGAVTVNRPRKCGIGFMKKWSRND